MIHGITYTDDNMTISAAKCATSMIKNGIDQCGYSCFNDEFKRINEEIFSQSRGCGYWLWKPFIIFNKLKAVEENDIVVYSDAGIEWLNDISHLVNAMADEAILLFGNKWLHNNWCKGDVMYSINQNYCEGSKQVQASVIIVRNTQKARDFIKTWLCYCMMPGMIDDSPSKFPNHANFQEHRHDQAILTSLAIREGIKLHWWPASYNNGQFIYDKDGYESDNYPVLFNHHRKRNNQY